jgi:hypothetical protein
MQTCGIFNDNLQCILQCGHGVSGAARAAINTRTRCSEEECRTGVRYCERYATRVRNKREGEMHNERQLLRTAGHLPGADVVFSNFNRRLENDGIRPRKVASLAEPQSLRTMLRFALVLPLHGDIRSPRGRSSEAGVTSGDR